MCVQYISDWLYNVQKFCCTILHNITLAHVILLYYKPCGLRGSHLCHFEKLWDSCHASEEFLIDVQTLFTLDFLHVKVLLCKWRKVWSQILRQSFLPSYILVSVPLRFHTAELCSASVVTTWPETALDGMSLSHRNSSTMCPKEANKYIHA